MDNEIRVELERIRDEDQRQNRRIELLEESVKANQELATSVHLLAHDMNRCWKSNEAREPGWTSWNRNQLRLGKRPKQQSLQG